MLVGSLLVGRQIVDRAKIQRIIFEFDYYEKAFHQFYDTYRVVPGSQTKKMCLKHSVFQGEACGRNDTACQNISGPATYNYDHDEFCNQFSLDISTSAKLISPTWVGHNADLTFLSKSGLIDTYKYRPSLSGSQAGKNSFQHLSLFGDLWLFMWINTSFDNNVYLRFYSFHKNFISSHPKNNSLLGAQYFMNKVVDKNIMILNGKIFTIHRTGVVYAATNTFTSAINSKLASELDAKIDDGRPTTGNLFGVKPSKRWVETDAEKSKQYCYDASGNDIEHAIYNTSTNTQYGCDIIKVMEDVK